MWKGVSHRRAFWVRSHKSFGYGFLKRLYNQYDDHNVAGSAAGLSYYFAFSLFPFLFFLATLTAYIPYVRASVDTLLDRAHAFLPPEAMGIVETHLRGLVDRPRPRLLTLGLIGALYSASRGVDGLRKAMNLAYGVKESRPLWKTEALAFGFTVGGALLVLLGIAVLVAGGSAGLWVARYLHLAGGYVIVLRWIRWPVTAGAIMLFAALCYQLLPNARRRFRLITPGSVMGTLAWFLASWGFGSYVAHFGSYNITYGSIGGVIVLMTWLYITGFILLMGGEINAIIESGRSSEN